MLRPGYVAPVQALKKLPRVDVVLALLLAAYAQLEIWHPAWALGVSNVTGAKVVLSATALAMTLPVAVRRRFPLAAVVIVMVATALQAVSTTPTEGLAGIVAGLLCVYSVAAYSDTARAGVGAAVAFAAIASQANNAGNLAFGTLIFGGAWLAGATVRRRQLRTRELEEETARLAVERDTAVARERARLARELHDVVAHSVSTMVVQAQAARRAARGTTRAARARLRLDRAQRPSGADRAPASAGPAAARAKARSGAPAWRSTSSTAWSTSVREAGLDVDVRTEGARASSPRGRPRRLPDRAGGPHERPQARLAAARRARRALRRRRRSSSR